MMETEFLFTSFEINCQERIKHDSKRQDSVQKSKSERGES